MDDTTSSIDKNDLVVSGEFKNLRKIRKFIEKFSRQAGFGEEELIQEMNDFMIMETFGYTKPELKNKWSL